MKAGPDPGALLAKLVIVRVDTTGVSALRLRFALCDLRGEWCLRRWRFAGAKRFAGVARRSEIAAMRGGGGCRLAMTSAVGYGLRPARDCAAVLGVQGFVTRSAA